MIIDIFVVLGAFILSYSFTYILIKYKDKIKIFDIPNERSMHMKAKPRSGGVAIFLAFLIGLFFLNLNYSKLFIAPACLVFFVGLYDDIYNIKAKVKLAVTLVSCAWLFFIGYNIDSLGIFFGYEINLGLWTTLVIFTICAAGFVNAVNLIDGLDGLSGSVSIVILIGFFYIGIKYGDVFLIYIPSLLIASILAFLRFNWYHSKIFMGDNGSLTIGFLLVIVCVYAIKMHYITPVSVLLIAGLPIMDTLIVSIRRFRNHKPIFAPDKTHMHHIILKLQHNDVRKSVLVLVLLQSCFTYLGLGFKAKDDILILIMFLLVITIFYIFLTPKYKRKYNRHKK